VCPPSLGGGFIDRSLFMDTQLGSDDFGLCIWTELKQNIKGNNNQTQWRDNDIVD